MHMKHIQVKLFDQFSIACIQDSLAEKEMMNGWRKVVIDFTTVNFVDLVGVKTIKRVTRGGFNHVSKTVNRLLHIREI